MAAAFRTFQASSKDAVLEAAEQAVRSLGHEVEHVEKNMGTVVIRTGGAGRSESGKQMTVTVKPLPDAFQVIVSGPGFPMGIPLLGFGRQTKRTIRRGQEIFEAMDAALAK